MLVASRREQQGCEADDRTGRRGMLGMTTSPTAQQYNDMLPGQSSAESDPEQPTAPMTILDLVVPDRPVTFIVGPCAVVVAREARTFDVGLRGCVGASNQHVVGEVLATVTCHAEQIRLSLGGL